MSSRPTDWSPLGLGGDPTPGDYDSVIAVASYMNAINASAGVIKQGLDAIYGQASQTENFAGQTATALSGLITSDLHNFLENVATSFSEASTAVNTYASILQEQQSVADNALSQAQGLNKTTDAAQIAALANTATGAGSTLSGAASIAGTAVDNAASLVVWPDSFWDRFWEALGWLAIFLMIPAVLFGGVFALIEFGLNFVLFIKAAVDFFHGDISVGQFLLSFLGILAPTTEPLDVIGILRGLLNGLKGIGKATITFLGDGIKSFGNLVELFGGVKLFMYAVPSLALDAAKVGGLFIADGIKAIPAFVVAGGRLVLDGITSIPRVIATELGGAKWLRLFLPVTAHEIDAVGLGGALRLGILERGLGFSADPLLNFRVALQGLKTSAPGLIKLSSIGSDMHLTGAFGGNDLHGIGSVSDIGALGVSSKVPGLTNVATGDFMHVDSGSVLNLGTLHGSTAHGFTPHISINPAELSAPSRSAVTQLNDAVLLKNPTELTNLFNHEAIVINTGNMTIVKFTEGIRPATVPSATANLPELTNIGSGLRNVTPTTGLDSSIGDLLHSAPQQLPARVTPVTAKLAPAVTTSLAHDPQKALDLLDHSTGISGAPSKDLAGNPGLGKGKALDAGTFNPADAGTRGLLDGHATPIPLRPEQQGPAIVQDAWLSYQAAHIDVANAADRVQFYASKVGESSKGMTPAELQAHADLADAVGRLDRAAANMHSLGADPLEWQKWQAGQDQAWLKDNPGLLGGMRGSTVVEYTLRDAHNNIIGTAQLDHATHVGDLIHPDGSSMPVEFQTLGSGGVRIFSPMSPHDWQHFNANGVLHSQNVSLLDHSGEYAGEMEISADGTRATTSIGGARQTWFHQAHPGGDFTLTHVVTGSRDLYNSDFVHIETQLDLTRPDGTALGTIVTDLRTAIPAHAVNGHAGTPVPLPGGGWRIDGPAAGAWTRFDASGRLTHEGFPVRVPGGRAIGDYTLDHAAYTHSITRPDGTIEHFTPAIGPTGALRFTDTTNPDHWLEMDGLGRVTAEGHVDAGPGPARVVTVDYSAGTGTITEAGVTRNVTAAADGGGITFTDVTTGVVDIYDRSFRLMETTTPLHDAAGNALGPSIHADYRNGAQTYGLIGTGPGAPVYAITRHAGGWEQADPLTGEIARYDLNGIHVSQVHALHDPTGVNIGHVDFDFGTMDGTLRDPLGVVTNVHVANAGGTLTVTDAADARIWQQFDNVHNLAAESRPIDGPHTPPNSSVTIYHAAQGAHQANTAVTVENGVDHAWDRFVPGAGGTYRLENPGDAVRFYDANNHLVQEHVPLRNSGTTTALVIHADYHAVPPTYAVHDAGGAIPHLTAVPHGDGFRITSTRPTAAGAYKNFDRFGAVTGERIPVLDRKAAWNGTYYEVDYTIRPGAHPNATWTHVDGAGNPITTPVRGRPGETRPEFNGAGEARLTGSGDLHLMGSGSPVYIRENLGGGASFELFRDASGKRYWHQFNDDGRGFHSGWTDSGVRRFSPEADAVIYRDVSNVGGMVRDFRKAVDGGVIRAVKQPDGSWRWSRFNGAGNETMSGDRAYTLSGEGWKDTIDVGGVRTVAQQQYGKINWSTVAMHYREYGVENIGGAFQPARTYKEISPQAKDTGGLSSTGANHSLEWVRLSEQRPPHWLWKTTDNLPWYDKPFGFVFGRKLGALDFPHGGWLLGDSRFQAFTWTETVNGVETRGLRVVLPDGSSADFSRGGDFIRGTTKLDTGKTLTIEGDKTPAGHPGPGRALGWKLVNSDKTVADSGFRYFSGHDWIDVRDPWAPPGGAPHNAYGAAPQPITRMSAGDGHVIEYFDPNHRPTYDPTTPMPAPNRAFPHIVRNNLGQIIERGDRFHESVGAGGGLVTATGDARKGNWEWHDATGNTGVRISSRNTRWTGSWDDSFTDFHRVGGQWNPVREYRALDKGTSLTAEKDLGSGNWRSSFRDAQGHVLNDAAHPPGIRQFDHGDGNWVGHAPVGLKNAPWRDVRINPDGSITVLRQTFDGRVRIFSDDAGTRWKEYDHGGVFRERRPSPDNPNIFRESNSFQKQWRETTDAGVLIRYRALSGHIWERSPFGRWSIVGREIEFKGAMTEFRGYNRSWREANRREYVVGDGVVGSFKPSAQLITQKALLDFGQDYLFDVAANIIITGAENNWNFSPDDWGKIFVGGLISSGIKAGGSILHETTGLKGVKDGLANVDGGKDFNRNPYNHDKFWDNEWAGRENPPRWRSTAYDFGVTTVGVGMLGSFVSNTVTGAVFGVGSQHVKVSGLEALKVGGLSALGTLTGAGTVSGPRTLVHQLSSGRFFQRGGLSDLTLIFGEKIFEKWVINYELIPALGLKPHETPSEGTTGNA
ncbi:hypothetical protein KDK95_11640 [Actinospica sp. MGRD01-02]|uniref:Uncharacterized protein n=1 Tax=Actinospica acidithermotolerans TaxID=2828514 RepID=A0A941EAE3_9ACTN|nr:hypothetical protein [Actinospica acidithermotolerans]MBR7826958.1 hypothetical protein [Actinospica acidithermotolerans]